MPIQTPYKSLHTAAEGNGPCNMKESKLQPKGTKLVSPGHNVISWDSNSVRLIILDAGHGALATSQALDNTHIELEAC